MQINLSAACKELARRRAQPSSHLVTAPVFHTLSVQALSSSESCVPALGLSSALALAWRTGPGHNGVPGQRIVLAFGTWKKYIQLQVHTNYALLRGLKVGPKHYAPALLIAPPPQGRAALSVPQFRGSSENFSHICLENYLK